MVRLNAPFGAGSQLAPCLGRGFRSGSKGRADPSALVFEGKVTADREPIEHVRYLKASPSYSVIDQKALTGRRSTPVKVNRVLCSRRRAACRCCPKRFSRIDRVLGQVGAEAELRDDSTLQDNNAVHGPSYRCSWTSRSLSGRASALPRHELLRGLGRAFQCLFSQPGRVCRSRKLLPGSITDPLHLRNDSARP